MGKDQEGEEGNENGELTQSAIELQLNMKILSKYQRFPLSDIYHEKKEFMKELRKKYGVAKIDKLIALQIDEYKISN